MDEAPSNNKASQSGIMADRPALEKRTLLMAPTPKDAELSCAVLNEAGLVCTVCSDPQACSLELQQGAGALLIAESVLISPGAQQLAQALQRRPSWSDLPVIVLTRGGAAESPQLLSRTAALGNVTLLEMPVRISTLLSTLRSALRARERQYQLRDQFTAEQQDKEALRESEEKFRLMAESAKAVVGIVQGQRFVYVNPFFEQLSGYSLAEILAMDFLDFVHPDFREQIAVNARNRQLGLPAPDHYEFKMVTRLGEERWMDFSPERIEYRGRPAIIGIAHDITEQKQAEATLLQVNAKLAKADRQKDEFLAMLAHELRNPLAPIRNAVQILQFVKADEQAVIRQRDLIDRQVTHMARLLDDLLEVSRITRGNVQLKEQPVKLVEVLVRAMETASPLVQARRHELTFSPPSKELRVHGDFDRLIQVAGNLLNNAAKYTEEGGRIWLEAVREGEDAVIRVRDTGVGIAPEMLPRVFDVFTQAERSLDRSQGGLGLGLTLVKNLVQMHRGNVEAHSAGLGLGSEFIVRLPALPQAEPAAEKPEASL